MTDDPLGRPALRLRHAAALEMLALAARAAEAAGQPQCITLVDAGGTVIAQLRMDGARLNALAISEVKARTGASTGAMPGCSMATIAGKTSRISEASSGCRFAYSSTDGCSPRR